MQITETNATGLKREYKVVVPADTLQGQIETRLKELGERIRMPGFRPGKVPLQLLKQRYEKSVMGEVLEKTVQEGSHQLLNERNLRPAGQPKVEIVSFEDGNELLDYVEDKSSFEEILGTLDVPAFSMYNPAATGKISRKKPLALNDFLFLKQHTDKAVKVTLPGPYLLTRSMWVEGLSSDAYPTKEDLSVDIVKVLREELEDLIAAGVEFVQFDEPVLTEVVFTKKNANRTFMCGALTAKADAEEELAFALDLINKVTDGMLGRGTTIAVHICRGNWSTEDDILLRGPYFPLIPYLEGANVDQLALEYATPRAGEIDAIQTLEANH